MPTNLVRSKQDEDDWAEARRIVDKQYPDKSPDDKDKSYWKLTTSIYENIKKNRGKKKMQKQASVGELLAGQLRLRKQADGNKRTADYFGGVTNWRGGRRGGGNISRLDQITADGYVDTAEYRPSWHELHRRFKGLFGWDGRNKTPMPDRDPMPRITPPRFPMPTLPPSRRPEPAPNNDPMDNERIRRLVEGDNAPNGGGWVGRPVDDSEIPLPSQDPGGWTPPKNTPSPNKMPGTSGINTEEMMRRFQEFNKNWRHHIMPMRMPDGSWSRSRWEWIGPGERPKEGPEEFEKYYKQYPSLRGGW